MRECAANGGKVPANGALGGSGDGEHIPAYSSGLEHPRMPVCHAQTAGKGEQGADVLSVLEHSRGFPQLGLGEESFTPLQLPPNAGPVSSKMAGKDEGYELHGIFQALTTLFLLPGDYSPRHGAGCTVPRQCRQEMLPCDTQGTQ